MLCSKHLTRVQAQKAIDDMECVGLDLDDLPDNSVLTLVTELNTPDYGAREEWAEHEKVVGAAKSRSESAAHRPHRAPRRAAR